MKKLFLLFGILALTSFSEPKRLTVTLTFEQWQKVLIVVDESKYHDQVKEVQNLLIPQLQQQLADTTKNK